MPSGCCSLFFDRRSKRLPVTTLAMDELRPAAADHVRILRIKLHRAVDAVRLLAGDQCAARAAKQIQHSLTRFRRVENRLDRQSGRFLRRMHIFPRIVTLDVPDRRLAGNTRREARPLIVYFSLLYIHFVIFY